MSVLKKTSTSAAYICLLLIASGLLFACTTAPEKTASESSKTVSTTTQASKAETVSPPSSNAESKPDLSVSAQSADGVKTDDSAYSKELSDKVLSNEKFLGHVKMCYMAAKQIPKLCQKLFCYCGCDYTDEHTTLLDCYTSDHSVDCSYCQGEAMMAFKMHRKGASDAEIQKAVDLNWGPHYPFIEQPSEAIKKYWKSRIWAPGAGPTVAEKHNEEKPLFDPFTGSQESDSKPMGKPSGNCCGGKQDGKAKR